MKNSLAQNGPSFIKLIECPRDAMQGWKHFIPTEKKIAYLNTLLKVGFDTLDFGSFVSPKAIPQMADTSQVIGHLDLSRSSTKLLAIIANVRGAEEACVFSEIDYLGFPFSISETFQLRNTNSTIQKSLGTVENVQELCLKNNKQLVVYISMGFGNPYGDPYSEDIVLEWINSLKELDVKIISLADTVGLATPKQVERMTSYLVSSLAGIEIGVHLHAHTGGWKPKIDAALEAGCMRFDGAMKGIGGCPMAEDELVGNLDTENLIPYFEERKLLPSINKEALKEASRLAAEIFYNKG